MSLIIGIESASPNARLFLANDNSILSESKLISVERLAVDGATFVLSALSECNAEKNHIDHVAVDVGPGRLGATRSGVSFANGLAFALRKPIVALSYFELIGFETSEARGVPALCIVQASHGLGYAAVFRGRQMGRIRYGALSDIVDSLCIDGESYCLTGLFSEDLPFVRGFSDQNVYKNASPCSVVFANLARQSILDGNVSFGPVQAVTEQHGEVDVQT